MGAAQFIDVGNGPGETQVFRDLIEQSRDERGSGGYTGTIAEKGSFEIIKLLDEDVQKSFSEIVRIVEAAMGYDEENGVGDERSRWNSKVYSTVDDKWGPAGCIVLPEKARDEWAARCKTKLAGVVCLFFGWASE